MTEEELAGHPIHPDRRSIWNLTDQPAAGRGIGGTRKCRRLVDCLTRNSERRSHRTWTLREDLQTLRGGGKRVRDSGAIRAGKANIRTHLGYISLAGQIAATGRPAGAEPASGRSGGGIAFVGHRLYRRRRGGRLPHH